MDLSRPCVRAPRLPPDPALWLNTGGRALQLEKGVVYLLDFWTQGCINCLHVLPDLAFLERKYASKPFAVIGVHCGKFPGEKSADSVRSAVVRHGIGHAVVRDHDGATRRAWGVRAWPTFVLVDAKGYVAGQTSGEGRLDELDAALEILLAGVDVPALVPRPVLERNAARSDPLAFPGKVVADAAGGRLLIADTGHHRVVVAPLGSGQMHDDYHCIGLGEPGWEDGPLADARFCAPQGLALSSDGRVLFVADTGNHAIRRVDLQARTVVTIAGTGQQARGPIRSRPARDIDLNSPWDLCLDEKHNRLFIALAGAHQIAVLEEGTITPFAGTGREACVDGPAGEAAFAQPSGLAFGGTILYVADSETSCVRAVDTSSGQVETLAGGGDLFGWGAANGTGALAQFQHPLGLAFAGGIVLVADTYNHQVRALDPATRTVQTPLPAGADLCEPGGLCVANNRLFVADTNHHRVRTVELGMRGCWDDVSVRGLCAPGRCFCED